MATDCGWSWSRLRTLVVVLGLAAASGATERAAAWIFAHEQLRAPARIVLGFLPVLMWVVFIVSLVQILRHTDELQQRIYLQAGAIAFLGTVLLALVFEYLEKIGIYRASSNAAVGDGIWLFAIVAAVFLPRRYR